MPAGDLSFYDKVPTKFAHLSRRRDTATGVRVVPPAVARRGSFIAKGVILMPSLREHRRLRRRRHHGRHLGHRGLLRADRQERAPVRRRRHRRRAGAAAGQPDHHRRQLLHRRPLRSRRRRDRRRKLGDFAWACTSARAPRSTTAPPARSAMAACRRARWWSAATCPSRPTASYSLYCAVIVKRVDAQDPLQDQHQRTAARLSTVPAAHTPGATHAAADEDDDEGTMSTMERDSQLMAEKKASDMYLSAQSPALIKINGQLHADQQADAAARRTAQPAGRSAPAGPAWRSWKRPASSTWACRCSGVGSFRCQRLPPARQLSRR